MAAKNDELALGDEVTCIVTGFTGIVVSKTFYLNGCVQLGVQSSVQKDGKFGESWSIDSSQLKLLKAKKVDVVRKPVGGPSRRIV